MRRYRLEEYTQYDKRNDEIKIVKTKKQCKNVHFEHFLFPILVTILFNRATITSI
jgi:hypothetical protein